MSMPALPVLPTGLLILGPTPSCNHCTGPEVLLVQASGQNVTRWMQQWTYTPGFPVLNVTLGLDGKAVHVTQARAQPVGLLNCPAFCWRTLIIRALTRICVFGRPHSLKRRHACACICVRPRIMRESSMSHTSKRRQWCSGCRLENPGNDACTCAGAFHSRRRAALRGGPRRASAVVGATGGNNVARAGPARVACGGGVPAHGEHCLARGAFTAMRVRVLRWPGCVGPVQAAEGHMSGAPALHDTTGT